jgi:hypothetical protein
VFLLIARSLDNVIASCPEYLKGLASESVTQVTDFIYSILRGQIPNEPEVDTPLARRPGTSSRTTGRPKMWAAVVRARPNEPYEQYHDYEYQTTPKIKEDLYILARLLEEEIE